MVSLVRRSDILWLLLALGLGAILWLRRKQEEPPIRLGDVNLQQGAKDDPSLQSYIDQSGKTLRSLLGIDALIGNGTYATWGDRATLTNGEAACASDTGFVAGCSLFERLGLKRTA